MDNKCVDPTDEEVVNSSLVSGPTDESMSDQMMSNRSTAHFRWKILSNALNPKSVSDEELRPQLGSVRRFESFGLIELKAKDIQTNGSDIESQTESDVKIDGNWFECRLRSDSKHTSDEMVVEIRLLSQKVPIYEILHSFDNTGSVCLWPSEEVLSYYCHKNRQLFTAKTVLELGGGMTSLSGLMVSIFGSAKEVILTDGNERCLTNVQTIVEQNRHRFQCEVNCRRLNWGQESNYSDLYHRIDIILCSDCLYFSESRHLLVETIDKLLKSSGFAIILAPTRGNSFDSFIEIAKQRFDLQIIENYDQIVYDLHKSFAETANDCHYIPDLHYPVMIQLHHKPSAQPLI